MQGSLRVSRGPSITDSEAAYEPSYSGDGQQTSSETDSYQSSDVAPMGIADVPSVDPLRGYTFAATSHRTGLARGHLPRPYWDPSIDSPKVGVPAVPKESAGHAELGIGSATRIAKWLPEREVPPAEPPALVAARPAGETPGVGAGKAELLPTNPLRIAALKPGWPPDDSLGGSPVHSPIGAGSPLRNRHRVHSPLSAGSAAFRPAVQSELKPEDEAFIAQEIRALESRLRAELAVAKRTPETSVPLGPVSPAASSPMASTDISLLGVGNDGKWSWQEALKPPAVATDIRSVETSPQAPQGLGQLEGASPRTAHASALARAPLATAPAPAPAASEIETMKQEFLEVVAANDLTAESLFALMDVDGSGCLIRTEFTKGCANLSLKGLTFDLNMFFDAMDIDQSRAVTLDEFLIFAGSHTSAAAAKAAPVETKPESVAPEKEEKDPRVELAELLKAQDMELPGMYKKLDAKASGKVKPQQFVDFVTKLGFKGNAQAVVDLLECEEDGSVSKQHFLKLQDDPVFKDASKALSKKTDAKTDVPSAKKDGPAKKGGAKAAATPKAKASKK